MTGSPLPSWRSVLGPERRSSDKQGTRVARQIEGSILAAGWRSGVELGPIRSIEERYAIGRSVAQEAVRILEIRGIVGLRRGLYGGLRISQPRLDRTALSLFPGLLRRGATIADLAHARHVIDAALPALLRETGRTPREALFRAPSLRQADAEDFPARLAAHHDLRLRIAQATVNPALVLFTEGLNQLSSALAGGRPSRIDAAAAARAMTAYEAAVRGGSADSARIGQAIDDLLHADLAGDERLDRHVDTHRVIARREPASKAIRIAREISADVLNRTLDPGERIGSEDELCEKYGVGRMTFRQAVRLLEEFEIADMRAGRGNGLFPCEKPGFMPAIRMSHCFLRSRQLGVGGWWQAMRAVQSGLVDRAIALYSRQDREALRPAVAALRGEPGVRALLDAEAAILRTISDGAGSMVLNLFWQILLSYRHRVSVPARDGRHKLGEGLAFRCRQFLDDFVDKRAMPDDFYRLLSFPLQAGARDWVNIATTGPVSGKRIFMPLV